jgi:hypothetical protein
LPLFGFAREQQPRSRVHDEPNRLLTGEMWTALIIWARHHLLRFTSERANPADMATLTCFMRIDHAIAIVRECQAR